MFDLVFEQFPIFFTWQNALYWGRALLTTLSMAAIGCLVGFVVAFVLVFLRTWPLLFLAPLRGLLIAYVEIFRRIPFLVLTFLVLFATRGFGYHFSLFTVACITIVLISTAYIAEIIRAGFEAIHLNQWESATVLNFGRVRTIFYVVAPQSLPYIIPPAFSYFVMFVKETSLTSQIGALELMSAGKYFNSIGISPLLAFGTCLLLYFALSYPLTLLGRRLEGYLKQRYKRRSSMSVDGDDLGDLHRMKGAA